MTDPFVDPGEPGEAGAGSLRAKDLVNRPILVRPHETESAIGQDEKTYSYVVCDVAVIGAGGIEEHATKVHFAWKRAIPQLESRREQWIGCTPKVQEDKSIILMGFAERGKEIARTLMPEVERLFVAHAKADAVTAAHVNEAPYDDEPPF